MKLETKRNLLHNDRARQERKNAVKQTKNPSIVVLAKQKQFILTDDAQNITIVATFYSSFSEKALHN